MFRSLLFDPRSPHVDSFLALLRILVGAMSAYHGLEVFDSSKLAEYAAWEPIQRLPAPLAMAALGKGLELACGVLLMLGLLTRPAGLALAVTMFFIAFKVGSGRFWYEDQHPFLFGLFGLLFFFVGPSKWSLDERIFEA